LPDPKKQQKSLRGAALDTALGKLFCQKSCISGGQKKLPVYQKTHRRSDAFV